MSGCSLPSNCRAEGVIPSYFPIENQMDSFAPWFAFHRDGCGGLKKCSSLRGESASAQIKKWAFIPPSLPSSTSIVIAGPIAEIDL
jgi:hypothetical protein